MKTFLLFLFFTLSLPIIGQTKINYVGDSLSSKCVKKIYDYYLEDFSPEIEIKYKVDPKVENVITQDDDEDDDEYCADTADYAREDCIDIEDFDITDYSKYEIESLDTITKYDVRAMILEQSKLKDSSYGVYTFRVCYQPHYVTKCLIILNDSIYFIKNRGFISPKLVVSEVLNIIKNVSDEWVLSICHGIYKYLYDDFGATYGKDIPYLHHFKSSKEKKAFIKDVTRNPRDIKNTARRIKKEGDVVEKLYGCLRRMNDVEIIKLLGEL